MRPAGGWQGEVEVVGVQGAGFCRIAALLVVVICGPSGASAAGLPACAPAVEVSGARIVRAEKNGVVVLSDGRAVVLEGIRLPKGTADHAPSFLAQQAIVLLGDLTRDRRATLTAEPPKQDRYGRIRAQIFFRGDAAEPWLQLAVLRRGFARVALAPDRPQCASELYAAERDARARHAGIWAFPAYAIRSPQSVAGDVGTFQIVEGTVKSADVRGGRAYLNFGDDWRNDFTVVIAPDDMKRFREAGIDPRTYAGRRLRVRGWVQSLNGPEIEIAEPEAIELVAGALRGQQ